MPKKSIGRKKFRFYTRLHLSELTGIKASNLRHLLTGLRKVSGSSIYHHTHRFLQQHISYSPDPPNDFAFWVGHSLGDPELAEKLASIDIMAFTAIRDLRLKIIAVIREHIKLNPNSLKRFCKTGSEFHFIKSNSFIIPTNFSASTLEEFADALEHVTVNSLYFHMFEARIRLEQPSNDFSEWIGTELGRADIADRISRLDPYTFTLEALRKKIIRIINGAANGGN